MLKSNTCVQSPSCAGTNPASCNARSRVSCSRRSRHRHHGQVLRELACRARLCIHFLSVRTRPPAPSAPSATMSPTPLAAVAIPLAAPPSDHGPRATTSRHSDADGPMRTTRSLAARLEAPSRHPRGGLARKTIVGSGPSASPAGDSRRAHWQPERRTAARGGERQVHGASAGTGNCLAVIQL